MIEGEELALTIGIVSALSFNPLSLAARALAGGTISNDELPTAFPTGVYGCARWGPLVGVLAGTRDPSDIGVSAASEINDLRTGGTWDTCATSFLPLYLSKAGLGPNPSFDARA